MKTRESGMPDEGMWESFFDPESILTSLGLDETVRDAVEFGCGYGTFTIPAARIIRGSLHALDIEPEMISATQARAKAAGLANVRTLRRDFVSDGTGLADRSVDHVMLFNILHAESPLVLLREAWRILRPGGRVSVIHWNYDPTTPRGPSMDIRPRPEDCRGWMEKASIVVEEPTIDLPPFHYGLIGRRQEDR